MRVRQALVLALLWSTTAGAPAGAVTGDEVPPPARDPAQEAYAAGLAAFEAGDWQGVIDRMAQVIDVRPWHADAHNRAGFAWRKLGDYDRALAFYGKALELNPHHRGALEYLGEAYLELDRPEDARALLERLATECRRVASDAGDWRARCEEWQDLKEAYDGYRAAQPEAAAAGEKP
jgi:tetratricopeptide (TPR) repeat protein